MYSVYNVRFNRVVDMDDKEYIKWLEEHLVLYHERVMSYKPEDKRLPINCLGTEY